MRRSIPTIEPIEYSPIAIEDTDDWTHEVFIELTLPHYLVESLQVHILNSSRNVRIDEITLT